MTASHLGAKSRFAPLRTFLRRLFTAGVITKVKDTSTLILFLTYLALQFAVLAAAIINLYCIFCS